MKTSSRGDDGGGANADEKVAADDNAAVGDGRISITSAAVAKKRLLPMELRRRRRAAKLLVSPPSKVNSVALTQDKPSSAKESPVQREKVRRNESDATLKRSATEELDPNASKEASLAAANEADENGGVATEMPLSRSVSSSSFVLPTPGSAASRLSSFYNWSAVDRKRQRLQMRMLTDVPSKFHAERIPVDLTPKAKATILTSFPLRFLRPSSLTRRKSMKSFVGAPSKSEMQAQNEIRWHQALHYFAHPATPLPAAITLKRMAVATKSDTKGGGKSDLLRDELEFYATRLRQWQDAFRDAYFGFRGLHGSEKTSFYVKSNDCTVCFYQKTTSLTVKSRSDEARNLPLLEICRELRKQTSSLPSQPEKTQPEKTINDADRKPKTKLCAVMSQSTARVRKALHRLNIEYATPYNSASSMQRDIGQFHLLEEELTAMESQARTAAASSRAALPLQQNVHGADSLLYFTGHQAVHGLYEFLVNRKPLTKDDVPEIYALHPFANAAIKSLDVKYMGHVAAGLTINEESAGTMFRTEVSGFCFPSALSEILESLRDEFLRDHSQRQEPTPRSRLHQSRGDDGSSASAKAASGIAIRAYMEQIPLTERFNSLHLTQGAIRKKTVSGTTLEERENWKHELELSKRRIESVIVRDSSERDEQSLFEVETTARTL